MAAMRESKQFCWFEVLPLWHGPSLRCTCVFQGALRCCVALLRFGPKALRSERERPRCECLGRASQYSWTGEG